MRGVEDGYGKKGREVSMRQPAAGAAYHTKTLIPAQAQTLFSFLLLAVAAGVGLLVPL